MFRKYTMLWLPYTYDICGQYKENPRYFNGFYVGKVYYMIYCTGFFLRFLFKRGLSTEGTCRQTLAVFIGLQDACGRKARRSHRAGAILYNIKATSMKTSLSCILQKIWLITRWFFRRDLLIPKRWRSRLQPLKGSPFHHPEKGTKNCQVLGFVLFSYFSTPTNHWLKSLYPVKTLGNHMSIGQN